MSPQEKEALTERLKLRMMEAHGRLVSQIAEKVPALYKLRLAKETIALNDSLWREAARALLEIVEEAGYTLPPKNDLRTQLLKAARELKANTWQRGCSDPDNVDSRAEEARHDAISDVGRTLLEALTED